MLYMSNLIFFLLRIKTLDMQKNSEPFKFLYQLIALNAGECEGNGDKNSIQTLSSDNNLWTIFCLYTNCGSVNTLSTLSYSLALSPFSCVRDAFVSTSTQYAYAKP